MAFVLAAFRDLGDARIADDVHTGWQVLTVLLHTWKRGKADATTNAVPSQRRAVCLSNRIQLSGPPLALSCVHRDREGTGSHMPQIDRFFHSFLKRKIANTLTQRPCRAQYHPASHESNVSLGIPRVLGDAWSLVRPSQLVGTCNMLAT